jgi:hypothetical protein
MNDGTNYIGRGSLVSSLKENTVADNSGSTGILGVIIGVVLVLGIIYFAFGERMGIQSASGPSTSVTVNAPKAPSPTK